MGMRCGESDLEAPNLQGKESEFQSNHFDVPGVLVFRRLGKSIAITCRRHVGPEHVFCLGVPFGWEYGSQSNTLNRNAKAL